MGSSIPITTSTTSRLITGISELFRPFFYPVSPASSLLPTPPECAADTYASRHSTFAGYGCRIVPPFPAKRCTTSSLPPGPVDVEACNQVAFDLYNLNADERAALGGNGTDG